MASEVVKIMKEKISLEMDDLMGFQINDPDIDMSVA
jgi:hypothetical protein